jgi:putative membrane protein
MPILIRSAALGIVTLSALSAFAAGLSAKDRQYFNETAEGLMAEVQLGEMAERQGQDSRVKHFGKQMI